MPQLPKGNSLDYNPDATVMASKKLSSIALERMKNPIEDPDQNTLSTLQAEKQLNDSFVTLEGLASNFHSLVLRLGGLLGKSQSASRKKYFPVETEEAKKQAMKGKGRKMKGGSSDSGSSTTYSGSTGSSVSVGEYLRNLAHDRRRFRRFYDDDDRNSTATPSASNREPNFDDAPEGFSRRSYPVNEDYAYYGEPFSPEGVKEYPLYGEDPFDFTGERGGANFNSLIFPIINLTRQMNILLISRIKPAIPALSSSQIERLTQIYQMVRTAYNDVVFPETRRARSKTAPSPDIRPFLPLGVRRATDLEENLIQQNEFGDEILSVWNTELQNLLLTLTVIINSWKQNTPTGQQTALNEAVETSFQNTASRLASKAELVAAESERPSETFDYEGVAGLEGSGRKRRGRPKKTGAMNLIGCGNNFYGENINKSHRDIPTIWSASMKNCPTKYLL